MPGADDDLRARVADLETTVAALRAQVAQLAAGRAGASAPSTRAAVPAPSAKSAVPARPVGAARPRSPDDRASRLEHLVGRYGLLALATLTTLAAVGTFVSWAAMHGLLGPTMRVALGLLLSAVLAGAGLRLRRREPSFGSALLGLSLAVIEVCAWAAGPGLRLVGDPASFALAAVASAALAAYALTEREQPLWCLGVGGAALAPFVATGHSGSPLLLAVYGAVVGIAAAAGIAARDWRFGRRTVAAVTALYAVALQFPLAEPQWRPLLAMAVPLVVAFAGILPLTSRDFVRRRLRAQGLIAALAAVIVSFRGTPLGPLWTGVVIAAAGAAWLLAADVTAAAPAAEPAGGIGVEPAVPAWIDGALVPLLLAASAAYALAGSPWRQAAVLAASAVVLIAAHWRRLPGPSRDALAISAALASLVAAALAPWAWAGAEPIADAALGVLFAAVLLQRPTAAWLVALAAALVAAGVHTWLLMTARPAFAYVPFDTRPSTAALAVLTACALVAWRSGAIADRLQGLRWPDGSPVYPDASRVRPWVAAAPWVWAFVWAHSELARAWSPSLSTFALVTLEAGVAVALVGIGRARDGRVMRRIGLLLAVVAAIRALTAVEAMASVSLRIASYLVASAFLLGIAYWYRRRGRVVSATAERADM